MGRLQASAALIGRLYAGFMLLIMLVTLCGSAIVVAQQDEPESPAPLAVAEMRDTPRPTLTPTPRPSYTAIVLPTPTLTPPPTFTRPVISNSDDCLGVPAYPEIRARNLTANLTPGQPIPESQYQKWNPGFNPYKALITGQGCLGTTEQILEWAAVKWGFGDQPSALGGPALHIPDITKALAVQESDWRQWVEADSGHGQCAWVGGPDCPYPNGDQTFGLTGIKRTSWPGSYPRASQSTAFAADYAMAVLRHHYDGASWLGDGTRGNLWAAVGAWYCGCATYENSWYTGEVKKWYATQPWRERWFAELSDGR